MHTPTSFNECAYMRRENLLEEPDMSGAKRKSPESLRSARWFAPDDLRSFGHRSRMMQLGYSEEDFRDKPIIGVLNTWSDFNSCHSHFKERVVDVKRGVAQAGGLAMEMPAISVDESFNKPTSMLYRNMLAMETEEQIRAHPLDGVVLMGGCDKTTPGLVMGAISASNKPAACAAQAFCWLAAPYSSMRSRPIL